VLGVGIKSLGGMTLQEGETGTYSIAGIRGSMWEKDGEVCDVCNSTRELKLRGKEPGALPAACSGCRKGPVERVAGRKHQDSIFLPN